VPPKIALLIAALLGVAANGNGFEGFLYPFQLWRELQGEVAWFPELGELRPPFSLPAPARALPSPGAFYSLFLLLSTLALLANLRRLRLAHALPFAVFLGLSLLASRNLPLFAVVAAPVTVRNLGDLLRALERRVPAVRRVSGLVSVTMLLVMPLVAATLWTGVASNQLYERLHWRRELGFGESRYFPHEAVEHLRETEGRFFNTPDLGGYLIWKLHPGQQVATDGRWEVYGEALAEITPAYGSEEAFAELADRHGVSRVVLGARSGKSKLMRPWLESSREWRLSLSTRNVAIFERRGIRTPRGASDGDGDRPRGPRRADSPSTRSAAPSPD